jgi:hypothetical protein
VAGISASAVSRASRHMTGFIGNEVAPPLGGQIAGGGPPHPVGHFADTEAFPMG